MKVGIEFSHFTPKHNGGKCQVAYNLLKGFCENGHIESIVCFCHEDLKNILLNIAPNVKIVIIPQKARKGILPRRIREGIILGSLVNKENIDIMFFTDKLAPIVKTKCKSVLIAHDILVFYASKNTDIEYPTKSVLLEKLLINLDFLIHDYIIAISYFDMDSMIKYIPISKNKIKLIYNPISFPQYINDPEKKYITALNIQHIHKNVLTLIKAFNEVKDEMNYQLVLVGKKPANIEEIEDYINCNNLENRVIITGFVTENELKDIISKTRIYVNPSSFEGFGMTSIEMMGNQVPVICADNSAQKEVTCGKALYYAPSKDAHALALAILSEINNPMDKELLKERALLVKNKYDYKTIANEYWDFFRACVEER